MICFVLWKFQTAYKKNALDSGGHRNWGKITKKKRSKCTENMIKREGKVHLKWWCERFGERERRREIMANYEKMIHFELEALNGI